MKNVIVYLLLLAFTSSFFLTSCKRDYSDKDSSDLYLEMLNYACEYQSIIQESQELITKADYNEESIPDIDDSMIDEKILYYIDLYSSSENLFEWDEDFILAKASFDTKLTNEEKHGLSKAIAIGYVCKNTFVPDMTKTSAEDCSKKYMKALKRATRDAIVELFFSLFEPTIIAESVTLTIYAGRVLDAQEDYNDCLNGK